VPAGHGEVARSDGGAALVRGRGTAEICATSHCFARAASALKIQKMPLDAVEINLLYPLYLL
jgi:hypothetical protein